MNWRRWFPALLFVLCIGAVAVFIQRRQLSSLQQQKGKFAIQASSRSAPATVVPADTQVTTPVPPSAELLELRSRITQLTQRKNELAALRSENENLHTQLAARGTNSSATLPPDYIRRTQAQWVGMSTPENTLQSFLWALQNHDLTNVFQVLDENCSRQLVWRMTNSPGFLEDLWSLPGMRIMSQDRHTNFINPTQVFITAQVEFIPGDNTHQPAYFELKDGQWKVDFGW